MKRLLILFFVFLFGRTGLAETSSHPTRGLTKEEIENAVIDQARARVLASGLVNDAQELELVMNTRPTLRYIFFGEPIADYKIPWRINSKETLVIHGLGNILTLEDAHIKRRN